MSVNPFNFDRKIRPNVPHSFFNESYDYKFTCNPGEMIPCYMQEVFPGDVMKYKNAFICKTLPFTTPPMIDMYAYVHYWYVPYRLLQSHETIEKGLDTNTFEDYINGIHDSYTFPLLANTDESTHTNTWNIDAPITSEVTSGGFAYCQVPTPSNKKNAMFSLVDYMNLGSVYEVDGVDTAPSYVSAFPIRAYNAIWNTKYRDQNLQAANPSAVGSSTYVNNDGVTVGISLNNSNILRRNWIKDYFTSMLPWQQKGTPIALPVTTNFAGTAGLTVGTESNIVDEYLIAPLHGNVYPAIRQGDGTLLYDSTASENNLSVSSTAFDINDLRLSNAVQKFLEANALGGTVYHQFCISHFGTAPRDETLNLPLYLGGTKAPVLISEVTQQSETSSTPQGTLTGKGLSSDSSFVFKEKFREHGIVMGIFSIMPMPVYSGGVNRMWIKTDLFDWYSPEFAHLGEQAIYSEELNVPSTTQTTHLRIIGYQGRWSEMRTRQNMCSSGFISSTSASSGNYGGMADWTVQRRFSTSNPAALNSSFIVCKPDLSFFAYPNSKNFIVDFGNIVTMSRPLPALAEPLLVG